MLIPHQKFRSCMIGHCNRSCNIITCNMLEMCGLIYLCAMRTVPMSCHVLPRVSTHTRRQAGCPYINVAHQKLLMDMPCAPAKQYLSKLTASHLSTLNMKIANRNMLKRILIAIHNKNEANCNENLRICAEEPVAPLYKR